MGRRKNPNLALAPVRPTRFRCKVGGEWKGIEHFSDNQQKFLLRTEASGHEIDAAHSGMTCREHTANSKDEMRCEMCQLIKPRDDFSKNSRRNGDYQCRRCTAWIETQEPDVVPAPLETGHVSVEEQNGDFWGPELKESTDFFPDDILPQAPITGLASLGLYDMESEFDIYSEDLESYLGKPSTVSGMSRSELALSTMGSIITLPPHLRRQGDSAASNNTRSGVSLSQGSYSSAAPSTSGGSEVAESLLHTSNTLPPHLRDRVKSSQLSSGSISTATTIRDEEEAAERARRVSFNAWDASGEQHRGVKAPTVGSSKETSSESKSESDHADPHDGWSTVRPRANAQPKRNHWHDSHASRLKPSELRNMRTPHIQSQERAAHIDRDIDRQRRRNHCDSDDSDF